MTRARDMASLVGEGITINGPLNVNQTVTASDFIGDGSSLTGVLSDLVDDITPALGGDLDLNSNNITGSGNIPAANLTGALPALSGANLTALNASNLGSGTIPDGRFPATLPAVSGANLTNLPAGGNFNLITKTSPTTSPSTITFSSLPSGVDTFFVAYSIRIAATLSDSISFNFLDASNSTITNQCYNSLRFIQKASAVSTLSGTGTGGGTSISITPEPVHFGNDRGGVKGYFWINGMNSDFDASTSTVFPSIVGQNYMDANIPGSSSSDPAFSHYGGSFNETVVTTFSRTGPCRGFRLFCGNGFGTGSVISLYSVTDT